MSDGALKSKLKFFGWIYLGVILFSACPKGESFNPVSKDAIEVWGMRRNPNPKWVAKPWITEADAPYLPIRRMMDSVLADWRSGLRDDLTNKAIAAFRDWEADCQNPMKLYRASAWTLLARRFDPNYDTRSLWALRQFLHVGWNRLIDIPESYEFIRMGYMFNSGDYDFQIFGDLAYRLLKRDANDLFVVLAMARELPYRKPDTKFRDRVLQALQDASIDARWRPWDNMQWAKALQYCGRLYGEKKYFQLARARALIAIERTGSNWNPEWIHQWLKELDKEIAQPQALSSHRGARFIWEHDPDYEPPKPGEWQKGWLSRPP